MANLITDCVAIYSFDSGVTFGDDTGKGHNLAANAGASSFTLNTSGGQPRSYSSLAGTNVMRALSTPDLSFENGVTDLSFFVNCWVRISAIGAVKVIFSKSNATAFEWRVQLSSGAPAIYLFNNGTNVSFTGTTTNATLSLNVWHMVTFVYNGNGSNTGLSIYVDGVIAPVTTNITGSYSKMLATTSNLFVGGTYNNSNPYSGDLDSIGIWNGLPTAANISELYNQGNGMNPAASSVKDFWRGFWSSDLSNYAGDSTGNGNLIAPGFNGVSSVAIQPGGKPDNYREYNGTTNVDVVANSATNMTFSTGIGGTDFPFGWCFFVYLNSTGSAQHILAKRVISGATPLSEWQVTVLPTGTVQFLLFGNNTNTIHIQITSTTVLTAGQWYFITGDYNGSKSVSGMRMFINNVQEIVTPDTLGSYTGMGVTTATLKIGSSITDTTYANFVNGRLDMIGVRACIFTLDEITQLYNGGNGMNPIVPNPLKDIPWKGFWSNDNPANRNEDSSGNGATLVLSGASNATAPSITVGGGKPQDYRTFSGGFDVNIITNSTTGLSFGQIGPNPEVPFGWCAWIRNNASTAVIEMIISKHNLQTPAYEWNVFLDSTNQLVFRLYSGNTSGNFITLVTTVAIPTGVWVFVAGDYDGSKTPAGLRFFRNGVLETTVTRTLTSGYSGMTNGTNGAKIGATISATGIIQQGFTGNMDMIGIRTGTFTPSVIALLYNNGNGMNPYAVPALNENWVLYWDSDNTSNDFAPNAPGQTIGILNDGGTIPALVSSGGRPGRYHTFDGTNTYNTRFGSAIGATAFTDGAGNDLPFTLTSWFYTNVNVGFVLLAKRDTTTPAVVGWQLNYNVGLGGLNLSLSGDTGGGIVIRGVAPFVPVLGQWYHVVATYDASKLATGIKIYIDGVEQVLIYATIGNFAGIFSASLIPIYIGFFKAAIPTNTLNGGIDGVGVRRGVTTAAEALQLYNGGLGLSAVDLFGTIRDNWLAWYNFDNLTANDNTVNKINLSTLAGTPLLGTTGKIGQAATISPTSYLGVAAPFNNFSFINSSQFCVSFWILPTGVVSGTSEGIFAKGIGTSDKEWHISHALNIRARFFTLDANNYQGALTTTAPMVDGVWQHIVVQKDPTLLFGSISIYHNGVLQAGNTFENVGVYTGMTTNSGAFEIGTLGLSVQRANGLYDLVGFRKASLTSDQVMELYNAGNGVNLFPVSLKSGWRGFWSSDIASATDSSGNGDLAGPGANATPSSVIPFGGKPKAYRSYNGTSECNIVINSGTNMSFSTGVGGADIPFGWCCFIYVNAFTGTMSVFNKRDRGATPFAEWQVYITTGGLLAFRLLGNNAATIVLEIITTVPIVAGQWYHFAGDYDGSKTVAGMRLFKDSILETAVNRTTTGTYTGMPRNTSLTLIIGAGFSSPNYDIFMNGRLDAIGVRDSIFTNAEIYALYNGGNGMDPFATPTTQMMQYF